MDGNARQVLVTETKQVSFWRKPLGRSVVLCVMTGLLLAFVVFPMFHADSPVDAQTYERLADAMATGECPEAQAMVVGHLKDGTLRVAEADRVRATLAQCALSQARGLLLVALNLSAKQ